jgi:ankyrin repeat protein
MEGIYHFMRDYSKWVAEGIYNGYINADNFDTYEKKEDEVLELDGMLLVACKVGNNVLAMKLLEKGANIEAQSHELKLRPIMYAAMNDNVELFNYLVKKNADLTAKNKKKDGNGRRCDVFYCVGSEIKKAIIDKLHMENPTRELQELQTSKDKAEAEITVLKERIATLEEANKALESARIEHINNLQKLEQAMHDLDVRKMPDLNNLDNVAKLADSNDLVKLLLDINKHLMESNTQMTKQNSAQADTLNNIKKSFKVVREELRSLHFDDIECTSDKITIDNIELTKQLDHIDKLVGLTQS